MNVNSKQNGGSCYYYFTSHGHWNLSSKTKPFVYLNSKNLHFINSFYRNITIKDLDVHHFVSFSCQHHKFSLACINAYLPVFKCFMTFKWVCIRDKAIVGCGDELMLVVSSVNISNSVKSSVGMSDTKIVNKIGPEIEPSGRQLTIRH